MKMKTKLMVVITALLITLLPYHQVHGEKETTPSLHISFNANGGSGEMTSIDIDSYSQLPYCGFHKETALFAGWTTDKAGKGTYYVDQDYVDTDYFKDKKVTLYAQWCAPDTKFYTLTYVDQDGNSRQFDGYMSQHSYHVAKKLFNDSTGLFAGWMLDNHYYKAGSKIKDINEDLTLSIHFKEKETTKLKGWKRWQETSPNASRIINCRVVNGTDRTYTLQHLATATHKWVNVNSYTLSAEDTHLRVVLPSTYFPLRQLTYWRIVADETDTHKSYTSPMMQLTIRLPIAHLSLQAKAAIIEEIDNQDNVVYQKHMSDERAMASITKLMTAIVATEHCQMNDVVTVSARAASTPWSTIYLADGEKIVLKDLMHAMLMASSNGSATAIGEHVAGSIKEFTKLMNAKAKELGCTHTHFVDAHGLSDYNHYSSAGDLAKIAAYAYKNDMIRSVIMKRRYPYKNANGQHKLTLKSTNALLKYNWMKGGKTGFTDLAGKSFAGVVEDDGHYYAVVVLGCTYFQKQWPDLKKMYDYLKDYNDDPYAYRRHQALKLRYISEPYHSAID